MGCATSERAPVAASHWAAYAPDASLEAELARARGLAGRGHVAAAAGELWDLTAREPRFLEAHRLLQDLLVVSPADWSLRRAYAERLAANPDDPDSLYLAARIAPLRERQVDLFEAVLARAPTHAHARVGQALALQRAGDIEGALDVAERAGRDAPWLPTPWLFMGYLTLGRANWEVAARCFSEAGHRDPADARAPLGQMAAAENGGQMRAAGTAAVRALRLAPGDEGVLAGAVGVLMRAGVPSLLREAVEVLESERQHVAHPAFVEAELGRLHLALGNGEAARRLLVRANEQRIVAGELALPLRRAHTLAGDYVAAVEAGLAAIPRGGMDESSVYRDRWRALFDAAHAASTETPDSRQLLRLAEAMLAVGWRREAQVVLARAAATAPADKEVRDRAVEERAFDRFLEDVAVIGRRIRDDVRADRGSPSVREVLHEIGLASAARLGVNLTAGATVRTYPFLGEFSASQVSDGAFAHEFDRRGLLLLVGERRGEGLQVMAGRIVAVRPGIEETVRGDELSLDEVWLETQDLPEGLGGLRLGLAGLTLDRLVLLQLDAILRSPRRIDAGLEVEPRPAFDTRERRALDTPSAVAWRIEQQLAAEGLLTDAFFDTVRRHELGHVRDARRMLPVQRHPLRSLGLLLEHGFDGRAIEQTLEARAQLTSLVDSAEPRAALSALLAFLPETDGRTAHAAGYVRAVREAIRIVDEDPVAFPSLDRNYNLLQQMDRLTDDEIRELGHRLLDQF